MVSRLVQPFPNSSCLDLVFFGLASAFRTSSGIYLVDFPEISLALSQMGWAPLCLETAVLCGVLLSAWFFLVCPQPGKPRRRFSQPCSSLPVGKPTLKITPNKFLWLLVWLGSTRFCHGAPLPTELKPRDAGDLRRAGQRDSHEELPTGRPVLQQTQVYTK